MTQAAGWAVIGQPFDRVEQRLGEIPDRARRRWALCLTVTVLALVPPIAHSQVSATPDATAQEPGGPARTKAAPPSLPPRALLRIGTTDLRMQDPILPVAFSPDGRLVAASVAGAVDAPSRWGSIFEVRTGRRIKQLFMPGNDFFWALSLAFSPDGSKLLCGMLGGEVAIWNVADGRLLFRRTLHTSGVTAVGFSSDGRFFASASTDGVVRLRPVERPDDNGRQMIMPPSDRPRSTDEPVPAGAAAADREPQAIGCLAFSPDGTRLVAGAEFTGMMAVWRVSDGQLLRQFGPDAAERLNSLAVTPDGRQILAGGSQQGAMANLRLWDIETGRRLRDLSRAEDRGWGHAALSADGRRIAAVDFTGVRILETATGKLERTIDLPCQLIRKPAFSPDGTLVTLADGSSVAIFEVATGKRLHHDASTPAGRLESAAWSPSGDRIVTSHEDGFVGAWDMLTGRLVWSARLAPPIRRSNGTVDPSFVAFSGDG